jgi:hypothetical protein
MKTKVERLTRLPFPFWSEGAQGFLAHRPAPANQRPTVSNPTPLRPTALKSFGQAGEGSHKPAPCSRRTSVHNKRLSVHHPLTIHSRSSTIFYALPRYLLPPPTLRCLLLCSRCGVTENSDHGVSQNFTRQSCSKDFVPKPIQHGLPEKPSRSNFLKSFFEPRPCSQALHSCRFVSICGPALDFSSFVSRDLLFNASGFNRLCSPAQCYSYQVCPLCLSATRRTSVPPNEKNFVLSGSLHRTFSLAPRSLGSLLFHA